MKSFPYFTVIIIVYIEVINKAINSLYTHIYIHNMYIILIQSV